MPSSLVIDEDDEDGAVVSSSAALGVGVGVGGMTDGSATMGRAEMLVVSCNGEVMAGGVEMEFKAAREEAKRLLECWIRGVV